MKRRLVAALALSVIVTGNAVGLMAFVSMVRTSQLPACDFIGVPEPARTQVQQACLRTRGNLDANESIQVYAPGQ